MAAHTGAAFFRLSARKQASPCPGKVAHTVWPCRTPRRPAPPQEQPALPSLCSDRRTSGTRLDSQCDQPPHPAFGHGSPGHDEGAFRCTKARNPNNANCPPPAMKGPFFRLVSGLHVRRGTLPRLAGPCQVACQPWRRAVKIRSPSAAARSRIRTRRHAPFLARRPHQQRPCRFPAQPATFHSPCLCGCRDNQHTAAHCPRCQPASSSHTTLSP